MFPIIEDQPKSCIMMADCTIIVVGVIRVGASTATTRMMIGNSRESRREVSWLHSL